MSLFSLGLNLKHGFFNYFFEVIVRQPPSPSFNPAKIAIRAGKQVIKRFTVCHRYKLRDEQYLSISQIQAENKYTQVCERFQQYVRVRGRLEKGSTINVRVFTFVRFFFERFQQYVRVRGRLEKGSSINVRVFLIQ